MKTFLATLSFALLSTLAIGAPKKEPPKVYFRTSDTLYIQFIDNIGYHGIGQQDRFRHFKNTMEEVLQEVAFPIDYKIVKFSANSAPPGQPRLDVTIMKWGDNGMSEIEARFSASIRYDFDRSKLGVFYYRGGSTFASSEQLTRTYNDILRKALVKMVSELNGRIVLGDELQAGADPGGESDEGGAED